ncbi:Structural maintenance of chromosomes protein 2 [Dictyocoela muelleri]|nr:Structural maintenance of chromosomes protein 2 [Dictyocoela muelleri]
MSHLESITLDGFKCYEQKTKVYFDKHFNCITGMNGSGKSNILDGIIFVLGIDSLKLLRVSTYKELININRKEASVSIFCNKYEISRFILSDGKTKYMVNGSSCTTDTVKKILGSINLRKVGRTPYFVVMQGHITKILDMKSENIRELIEETAGIREYHIEKEKALAALERKEIKLRETKESIHRRLSPFFDRLRKERDIYLKQKNSEDRAKIVKNRMAALFMELENNDLAKSLFSLQRKLKDKQSQCEEVNKIKKSISELQKETSSDNLTGLLHNLEQINISLEANRCAEIKSQLYKLRKDSEHIQIPYIQNIEDLKEKENFLLAQNRQIEVYGIENLDKQLDTVCEIEAKQKFLANLFLDQKSKIQNITNLKNDNLNHFNEIYYFLIKIKNSKDFEKSSKKFKNSKYHNFFENILGGLIADLKTIQKIKTKNEKIKELKSRKQMILENLNYPLQEGVYGTVEENIELPDKKYKTAVNCAMGSRGKYVIVENENIGKQVLKEFNKRISIIPLNKITSTKLYKKGRRLIDVINFEKKLINAMEFIFGNFYLYEDREMAKKMCFEEKLLTITLDGTIYNPKGTLSGGKYFYHETQFKKSEIDGIEKSMENIYEEIIDILNDNQHLRDYFCNDEKENFNNSENTKLGNYKNFAKIFEKIDNFINQKNEHIEIFQSLLKTILEFDENIQKINFIKNLKNCNVKKELESVRATIIDEMKKIKIKKDAEEKIKKINDEIEALEDEYRNELVEMQVLMNKKELIEEKIKNEERRRSVKIINERDIETLEKRLDVINDYVLKISHKIRKEIKSIIYHIDESRNDAYFVSKSPDESVEMSKIIETNGSFLVDAESPFQFCDKISLSDLKNYLLSVLSESEGKFEDSYRLILELKIEFLNENDENNIRVEYKNLNNELEELKKMRKVVVDQKNFDLLEQNDEKIAILEKKVAQLENDKVKIKKSIEKYSEMSKTEFEKAFIHLNKKVGRILSDFLTNADAKITKEFELIVKIGDWKSRSELSGGQRSLVALSLIFSILTYNPSPFYIFDEIDSALDLNHTQNIGEIIKKEFSESQFIVVSLKDNLFRNANRIHHVYVEDGKSKVKCIKDEKNK